MKITLLLLTFNAFSTAAAYPGMGKLYSDLHNMQLQNQEPSGFLGSTKLLGDLAELPGTSLSKAGADIKAVLSGGGQPLGDDIPLYDAPGPLGSVACTADVCCVYKYAMISMVSLFTDPATGGCSALARSALRLGFHDAASWNMNAGYGGGGADGSILLSAGELSRPVNTGLEGVGNQTMQWYNMYHCYGASMADLIQLSAMTAVVTCPGGPRMRFYAGRIDNTKEATDGLLPDPTSGADALADLFQAKSFTAGGLAALIGAHTISQQFYAVPSLAGASQDTTPGVWDNSYYNTTLATTAPPGIYRQDGKYGNLRLRQNTSA
ncbi:peroxidase manganese-dependent 1 [Niveomyces insectorum RCEF 264]|uniref:Peroxidase n=1 Tax=Niveomyces insectorum RCEF 264 TaxID=1081102 RepID=A0A167NFL8_9HYPO|nr:peroxidase manganese-dependent 1 [Niveomyces insectorum RCEF 264]